MSANGAANSSDGAGDRRPAKSSGQRRATPRGGGRPAREAVREAARRQLLEQRRRKMVRRRLITAGGAVSLVLVAVATMVVVNAVRSPAGPAAGASGSLADQVIKTVTSVPTEVLDQVGKGRTIVAPQAIPNQRPLVVDGKPLIVYIGAEFCPFCASQRWAVVVALSRFGTFSNLGTTASASDDVYPNTQSLSFHGATYTSQYLAFQGVETATNVRQGNHYQPLDQLTPLQNELMNTLNAPPYVSEDSAGAIPFMDFANAYLLIGGSYEAEILQKKSAQQIASALSKPDDPIAQGILGTANMFTTILCRLTNAQPSNVCTGAAALAYEGDN